MLVIYLYVLITLLLSVDLDEEQAKIKNEK